MSRAIERGELLRAALNEARDLVERAIRILDEAGASADIAAHLDLAIHRMVN